MKTAKKNGFIKVYSIHRDGWANNAMYGTPLRPTATLHLNIGYIHYFVADGLRGLLKAIGWKWLTDGSYDRIAKDKWME